jgi:hypothetical protein
MSMRRERGRARCACRRMYAVRACTCAHVLVSVYVRVAVVWLRARERLSVCVRMLMGGWVSVLERDT